LGIYYHNTTGMPTCATYRSRTTTHANIIHLCVLDTHTGEFESESDASLTAQSNMGSSMQRQDSSTSLATVNIGGGTSADGGASFNLGRSSCQTGDDIIDDISLSGASVTYGSAAAAAVAAADAASTADSASSYGTGQVGVVWAVCL
jgi:hypothetical protein